MTLQSTVANSVPPRLPIRNDLVHPAPSSSSSHVYVAIATRNTMVHTAHRASALARTLTHERNATLLLYWREMYCCIATLCAVEHSTPTSHYLCNPWRMWYSQQNARSMPISPIVCTRASFLVVLFVCFVDFCCGTATAARSISTEPSHERACRQKGKPYAAHIDAFRVQYRLTDWLTECRRRRRRHCRDTILCCMPPKEDGREIGCVHSSPPIVDLSKRIFQFVLSVRFVSCVSLNSWNPSIFHIQVQFHIERTLPAAWQASMASVHAVIKCNCWKEWRRRNKKWTEKKNKNCLENEKKRNRCMVMAPGDGPFLVVVVVVVVGRMRTVVFTR